MEKELIPNLRSMIEVEETSSPLTNERYTGNTEGAIYGFHGDMNNSFLTRIQNTTPIKGLYLAGHWGSPLHGYCGAILSARQTAYFVKKQYKL